MEREEGWYWVRPFAGEPWKPAEWRRGEWWGEEMSNGHPDEWLDTIGPRIEPPPSEAKSDRRDPGFYWVEEGYSLWVPAEWTEVQHQGGPIGGYWTVPGSEIEYQDSDFTAIGDKLVQPPHRKMETGSEPHWKEPPPGDGEGEPGW